MPARAAAKKTERTASFRNVRRRAHLQKGTAQKTAPFPFPLFHSQIFQTQHCDIVKLRRLPHKPVDVLLYHRQ